MKGDAEIKTKVVEIDERHVSVSFYDEATEGGVRRYSMDDGLTWHDSLGAAYGQAKRDGVLSVVETHDPQEDFHAWTLAMVLEIQALKDGEELRVSRTEGKIVVSKQEVVLVTRASTVNDVELKRSAGA